MGNISSATALPAASFAYEGPFFELTGRALRRHGMSLRHMQGTTLNLTFKGLKGQGLFLPSVSGLTLYYANDVSQVHLNIW